MRVEKNYITEELKTNYADSKLMIAASYDGLSAEKMNELRSKVAAADGKINVVKNRLLKRILPEDADPAFNELLTGANAIANTAEDIVALAKAVAEFAKENSKVKVKGGLLDYSKAITADDIKNLASLPPKEILLAKLLGAMQGPITNLAGVFNAMLSNTVRVLDQIAKLKEAQAGEQKSEVAEPKPEVVEQKPEVAEQKPEVAEQKPEEVEHKPEVVEQKSEVAEQKPEVVEQKTEEKTESTETDSMP